MMKERTIMIFPHFQNGEQIENIRKQYDSLSALVAPHITLVFPFASECTVNELEEHITTAVKDVDRFELVLQKVTMHKDCRGNYLFLNMN